MSHLRHERAFFESFVTAQRRPRWLALVEAAAADPRRRRRLTNDLNHKLVRDLDPRFTYPIVPARFDSDAIAAAITATVGETSAYVLSDERDLDGRTLPIGLALDSVRAFGTVVSIVPGRLAFHMAERCESADRFLLMRDLTVSQQNALQGEVT